jgi:hypothetical protein
MTVRGDGNVGIGTTAPGSLLQVGVGNATANSLVRLGVGYDTIRSSRGGIDWHDGSNVTGKIHTEYDGTMVSMVFGSLYNSGYNSNSLMVIRGNGNVGIGTTSPASKLTVNASANSNDNAITIYSNNSTAGAYTSIGSYFANGNTNVNTQIRFGNENTSGAGSYLAFATGVSTSAIEKMRITSAGNVGIGNTSPTTKLHVEGSAAIGTTGTEDILLLGRALSGGVSFQQAASLKLGRYQNAGGAFESYTRLDFALRDNSAVSNYNTNTTVMTLTNAGNVGIGTTNPVYPLDIVGFANSSSGFRATNGTVDNRISWSSGNVGFLGTISNHPIALNTNATERVRITATGDVGIGTTSPGHLLDVAGTGRFIQTTATPLTVYRTSVSSNVGIRFQNDTTSWYAGLAADDAFGISFNNANLSAGQVKITTSGNVGIGTTSPNLNDASGRVLHINASGTTASAIHFTNATTGTASSDGLIIGRWNDNINYLFTYENEPLHFGTNNAVRMVISAAGSVGIGNTNPGAPLDVTGIARATSLSTVSGLGLNVAGYAYLSQSLSGVMTFLGHNVRASDSVANTAVVQNASWISSLIKMYYSDGITFHTDSTVYAAGATYPLSTTERLRITPAGNVGIGTTAPTVSGNFRTLEVKSGDATSGGMFILATSDNAGVMRMYSTSTVLYIDDSSSTSDLYLKTNGANYVALGTNNAERLRVTSTGNVGIGTTSPAARLDVNGNLRTYTGITSLGYHGDTFIENILPATNNGAATGEVQLRMWCSEPGVTWDWAGFGYNVRNDNGSPAGFGRVNTSFGQAYMRFATTGDWYFYNTNTSGTRTTTMTLTGNGDVGIGTTAPSQKLHVNGDALVNGNARITSTNALFFQDYGGGWFMQDTSYLRTYNQKSIWTGSGFLASEGGLSVGYGGATPPWQGAIINGNVGIGTTSPTAALSISRGVGVNAYIEVAGNNNTIGTTSMLYGQDGGSSGYVWNRANAPVYFGTNNSTRMFLTAAGDFGIGTTSPSAKLHVEGRIYTGDIGIATTSPTQKLHVAGNARIAGAIFDSFNLAGSAGQVLSSTGTGIEWVTGGGGGGSTIAVKDEGTSIGSSFTTLNFVGENIEATASGSTAIITAFNNAGTGSIFIEAVTTNYAPGATFGDVEIDSGIIFASSPDAASGSSKLIATVTFGVENVSLYDNFNNFEFRLYDVSQSIVVSKTTHTWTGYMSKDEGATKTVFTFHIPIETDVAPGDEIRVQAKQSVSYTPEIYYCALTLMEGTN